MLAQAMQAAVRVVESSASAAQTATANRRGAEDGRMLERPRSLILSVQDEAHQTEMQVLETSDKGTETERRSHSLSGGEDLLDLSGRRWNLSIDRDG